MEILAVVLLYLAIGTVSTGFFKIVEDWFVDVDSGTAPCIILLWPIFWIFFILKVVTWPVFLLASLLFD